MSRSQTPSIYRFVRFDYTKIKIEVTAAGFSPKNSELETGSMLKAVFSVDKATGSDLRLISKDLNIEAPLKPGDNIFLLNNPQPGVYEFQIGGTSYTGTFTVREKLSAREGS
jgi:hypothetical protein